MFSPGKEQMAIIGGGISGLSAAISAIENGQDPKKIHIYEGSKRLGGKIQNADLNGKTVNAGAEFVDTDSPLVALCLKLGVGLVKSEDQQAVNFQLPDGQLVEGSQFFKAYTPIAHQIIHHKQELADHPNGLLAQQLNKMTFKQYMDTLCASVPVVAERSVFDIIKDWFTGNPNRVNPDVVAAATAAYSSEVGQPPENICALQFVHEASSTPGEFLHSDCGYRVQGGTEAIITAAKNYLMSAGMSEDQFHLNNTLQSVDKLGDNYALSFVEKDTPKVIANKVVMALPAYGLAKIEGLSNLGISEKAQQMLGDIQYTNNVKFMVTVKPDTVIPNANFFSNQGFQSWRPEPDVMTFLVNAQDLGKDERPNELVARCLDTYARAHGKSIHDIFDTSTGNIILNNPGKSPCYATPAPGMALALHTLHHELAELGQGVSVVGTFLPGPHGEIGFMDCGVASAAKATSEMLSEQKQRPKWLEQTLGKFTRPVPVESGLTNQANAEPSAAAGRGFFS
jgi:cytochrome c1